MSKMNWALIVILVMMVGVFLVGCGTRDDGMGDLWKGVQYVDRNR